MRVRSIVSQRGSWPRGDDLQCRFWALQLADPEQGSGLTRADFFKVLLL